MPQSIDAVYRELLEQILAELRGIRSDLRGGPSTAPLLAALKEEYGAGAPFSVAGLLDLAETETSGPLASSLEGLINMNGTPHGRRVALGRLLQRMRPEIVPAGSIRDIRLYQVAGV